MALVGQGGRGHAGRLPGGVTLTPEPLDQAYRSVTNPLGL